MVGLAAAAILVAHADRAIDIQELRRLIAVFRTHKLLAGFSVEELTLEIALHIRGHEHDPQMQREEALAMLARLELTETERDLIMETCRSIIVADGAIAVAEIGALNRIEAALRRPVPSARQ